jgi:type II secretory pathway component PulM
VKSTINNLQGWWSSRSASERRTLSIGGLLLGAIVFGYTSYAVKSEQDRLQREIPLATLGLLKMQDDATIVDRLRSQAPQPALQGPALVSALSATLRSHGLDLAVTTEGTNRLRVQGRAGFDPVVTWLAAVQRDYQLRVGALAITRHEGGVKIDAALMTRGE